MKSPIRMIILAALLPAVTGAAAQSRESFSPIERARLHPLQSDRPETDFFAGALLGNGAMGVVVTTRPDSVVLYFGHNNVWDIRIAENNREKIGTFREVFEKVKSIPKNLALLTDDPWYREYGRMAQENYRKPYPRPFPCGSVVLGFDRRKFEMLGHRLDISDGLCEVSLLAADGRRLLLQAFTDMARDDLWLRLVDVHGNPCENIFERVRIITDPSTPPEFPKARHEEELARGVLAFRQTLPFAEPGRHDKAEGHPRDRAFRLAVATGGPLEKRTRIDWNGNEQAMAALEAGLKSGRGFIGRITIQEGLDAEVAASVKATEAPLSGRMAAVLEGNRRAWRDYWNKSGVRLGDRFLERMWYHNLYFLNCSAREGVTTPGLFANWSHNKIGTAWHGDYHMNYNTQQPFWVTFSSNHLEKNLPYVDLIERLMPVSRRWAREYYGLPGAYFPHSAYPVEMNMNPYPVPTWGWEICETPWAVQGLWWHYLYSRDIGFLRARAFEPIKAAVEFLVAYMKRPEASGPQWKDDRFHIFPTVPPELYGLRPGFQYNHDCNVDLALTKFAFGAFAEASRVLGREAEEKALLDDVRLILSRFPDYPTAVSEEHGRVLVSVPGEHDKVVYNVPIPLFAVFPGEDHSLISNPAMREILANTHRNQQNEGGNDLVLLSLQAARIGLLDLERFKRQVRYCLMPNGTASDRVLQVHGRYRDTSDYGFMDRMGVWFENFALPAVVNECLMQSHGGTIRLFPNWPAGTDAEFRDLRAVGAFLVSACMKDGAVRWVRITSEAGGDLRLICPWSGGCGVTRAKGPATMGPGLVSMTAEKGEVLLLEPLP